MYYGVTLSDLEEAWKVGFLWYKIVLLSASFLFVCLLLFYIRATLFQLYHGSDMLYEMKKTEPTLLPTKGIFNFLYHIDMV